MPAATSSLSSMSPSLSLMDRASTEGSQRIFMVFPANTSRSLTFDRPSLRLSPVRHPHRRRGGDTLSRLHGNDSERWFASPLIDAAPAVRLFGRPRPETDVAPETGRGHAGKARSASAYPPAHY